MDGEKDESKSFYLFGRDITQIPCFRDSFLYGIGAGMVSGLGYFMFTSRTRMATHVSIGSFCLTTFGFFTVCRYQYAVTKFEMLKLQAGMQDHLINEETAEDSIERKAIGEGLDLKSA